MEIQSSPRDDEDVSDSQDESDAMTLSKPTATATPKPAFAGQAGAIHEHADVAASDPRLLRRSVAEPSRNDCSSYDNIASFAAHEEIRPRARPTRKHGPAGGAAARRVHERGALRGREVDQAAPRRDPRVCDPGGQAGEYYRRREPRREGPRESRHPGPVREPQDLERASRQHLRAHEEASAHGQEPDPRAQAQARGQGAPPAAHPKYANELVRLILQELLPASQSLSITSPVVVPQNTLFDYMCTEPFRFNQLLQGLHVANCSPSDGTSYFAAAAAFVVDPIDPLTGVGTNPFAEQFTRNGGVLNGGKVVNLVVTKPAESEMLETAEQTLSIAKLLHDLATAESEAKHGNRISIRPPASRSKEFSKAYIATSKELMLKETGLG